LYKLCKAFLLPVVWKKYLTIAEVKALIILALGVMISIVIEHMLTLPESNIDVDLTYFDSLAQPDKRNKPSNEQTSERNRTPQKRKNSAKQSLKVFDINYASARDLYGMGLSSEFVRNWFAAKSGKGFVTSMEEFRALQVCSNSQADQLEPYLDWSRYNRPINRVESLVMVDLNTADSSMLTQLRGVGKVLASRIVRYRNRLGGFVSEKQLLEVYGVDSSVFSKNQNRIVCTGEVVKIDLNNVTKNGLSSHPYISWSQAKLIVRFREQHGDFKHVQQLYALHGADSTIIHRVEPYLEITDD